MHIAHRRLRVLVPELRLQLEGIDVPLSLLQRVRVPEDVWADALLKTCRLGGPFDALPDAVLAKRLAVAIAEECIEREVTSMGEGGSECPDRLVLSLEFADRGKRARKRETDSSDTPKEMRL